MVEKQKIFKKLSLPVRRLVLLGAVFALIATLATSALLSHSVAADTKPPVNGKCDTGYTPDNPTNPTTCTSLGQPGASNTTTCAVEKIGWILCPIISQA